MLEEFEAQREPGQTVTGFLRQHPGLVVSLIYLTVSLIGLLFSYSLFREFGINIFLYAEISDFLLAALREPMTFAVAGVAILTGVLLFALSNLEFWWYRRHPPKSRFGENYHRLSQAMYNSFWTRVAVFVLYAYLFLSLYGEYKSEQIRSGHGDEIQLFIAGDTEGSSTLRSTGRTGILLGTTNKFVFVYDPTAGTTNVIPNESIIRIVLAREETEDEEQD